MSLTSCAPTKSLVVNPLEGKLWLEAENANVIKEVMGGMSRRPQAASEMKNHCSKSMRRGLVMLTKTIEEFSNGFLAVT